MFLQTNYAAESNLKSEVKTQKCKNCNRGYMRETNFLVLREDDGVDTNHRLLSYL